MGEVVIIGSGFSGLATACCLADAGFKVKLLEKNNSAGGRARQFNESGFTFDMGPSWYWMPDVFEQFFNKFNLQVSDLYQLKRLDPSYRMFFRDMSCLDIPASYNELKQLFESLEPGAGRQLDKFLEQAQIKYEVGMNDLIFKPGISPIEFVNRQTISGALRLDLFQSFHKHVRKYFRSPVITQLLTFPILFLGASAKDTPALYSLMNYADIKLGTWYPEGGMYKVVNAMVKLAKSLGVKFHFEEEVQSIEVVSSVATEVKTKNGRWSADLVVA